MPVEIISGYDIEIEPVITDEDRKRIKDGKNRKLKAMLWDYDNSGTSRGNNGEKRKFAELATNILEVADPEGNFNKHRGGSEANSRPGLRAFFRLTKAGRDRRRR